MSNVFTIGGGRSFTLEEANDVLAIVKRITKRTSQVTDQMIDQLERMDVNQPEKTIPIEEKVNAQILRWQSQIRQLGLEARGLWMVDFKTDDGFYSWQYPEAKVEYWHSANEGFANRKHISEKVAPAAFTETEPMQGTRDSI